MWPPRLAFLEAPRRLSIPTIARPVCLRNEEENETMRSFVLSLSFCVACCLLVACGGAGNENTAAPSNSKASTNAAPANSSANTTASNTATSNANAASANTSTSSTGTKIGVPECDDYLDKYEACVTGKVPAAARATFTSTLETTKKSWRDLAATPTGKASLAQACKTATEAAKQAMKSYGCEF